MDAVYDLSVSSDAGLLQQLSEVLSDEGISLEVLKYAVSCAGSLPSVSSEELTGVVEMVKNTGVQNTILLLFKFLEEAKLKASWLCARNEDLKDKLGKQVEEIAADHSQLKGLPHHSEDMQEVANEELKHILELTRFNEAIAPVFRGVILGLVKQQDVASKMVSELQARNENLESKMESYNQETELSRYNRYLDNLTLHNPEMDEYLHGEKFDSENMLSVESAAVTHDSSDGKLSPVSKKSSHSVSSTRGATQTADQEARDEDVLGELPWNHQVRSSVDHA